MPVPGYDPDDLDAELEGLLSEPEIQEHLTNEEFQRYKGGTSLIDLLSEEDVHELLDEHEK